MLENDNVRATNRGAEVMRATKEESRLTSVVKIHNDTSERLNDVTCRWFSNRNSGFAVHDATKDKSSISNVIPSELYTLKFYKVSPQVGEVDQILAQLEHEWCQFVSAQDFRHLWLEIERQTVSSEALASQKHTLQVVSMSLGSFPSHGRYCCHWRSCPPCPELKEITVGFDYDLGIATIQYLDRRRGNWKLETAFDNLDKYILVTTTQTGYRVYLFQKNPFQVSLATRSRPSVLSSPSDVIDSKEADVNKEFLWIRQLQFGDCSTEIIGSCNVIQLQLGKGEPCLNDVLSRFSKQDFNIVAGNPTLEDARVLEPIATPEFRSFRLTYAWFCLLSRGFRVTDQLSQKFIDTLNMTLNKGQQEPTLEETVEAITSAFDNASICNLENQFHSNLERITSRKLSLGLEDEKAEPSIPHIVAIRRLMLTPTTIKGLGEEWTVENRVLREYGSDRFVRVSLRDDDFTRLTSYIPIHEIKNRITDFLRNGFKIGDRHYQFLGCSNSQLRSHSVWMYASDGRGHTVDSIRTWMGDISHERCVATYVSRLGQCFTSTRNTVEVKNVEWIEDITGDTMYCFTDGIGRISAPLARRVAKTLNLRYTPSAYQIRFGGCKGVVSLAPDLGGEEKLQLRKSMEKFPSEHNQLEVVEMTRPVRLCLNRQAMLLLSGLGVPDEAFFKLQDNMLINMADILFDESNAVKVIAKAHLGIDWKQLKETGIIITMEPFLREVLATIYRKRFQNLFTKTHIEIPEDKGRMMIGTVDEFACLEYGEVFIQFSKDIDHPKQEMEVLNRTVVVTKNPCFHPGDMRKFKAVDKVELRHMVDCIVFPAKGPRPHPNEMSGSDLDGDMYFVCWEESLIPPTENYKAMDFTPQKKYSLSADVTEADMIQFIGHYIDSDQLGIIANAHLVYADSNGVHCRECIDIAQAHSNAVDFPKTGQVERLPQILRPVRYPDYMMKSDKPSYISSKVIGKLFQQCRTIELSNEFRKLEPIVSDSDLILPGHEAYLEGATVMKATYMEKMNELKVMYGIATDVELLSVGTIGMQKRLGQLKGDHYAIAEIIKLRLEAIKEQMKKMFYKEFGGENRHHDSAMLCQKASALYKVSYGVLGDNGQNQPDSNLADLKRSEDDAKNSETEVDEHSRIDPERQCLGLPWIFWDFLCRIKKQQSSVWPRVMDVTILRPKSFLHHISVDIAAFKIRNLDDEASQKRRVELLRTLTGFIANNEAGVKLIPFGSIITDCANNASSLDVLIEANTFHQQDISYKEKLERFKKTAKFLADKVRGELMKSPRSKPSNKKRIFNVPGTTMEITLFCDSNCLWRTAYIVAAMTLNKWTVPVLRVVLSWGRYTCTSISGSSRDSLLSEEELTIMFFHYATIKYGYSMSEDVLSRSKTLLMENHFSACHLDDCTHIRMSEDVTDDGILAEELSELCTISGPVDAQWNLSASNSEDQTRCGKALLGFFCFYGVCQGRALKDVHDPGQVSKRQSLLKLKDLEYIQLGEQMMQAYHSLANCCNIDDFLHPSGKENSHFTMVVPSEVSSIFKYVEVGWEETLMEETAISSVRIRKKMFRGLKPGHIISASGNAETIRKLKSRIHVIIGTAACFAEGNILQDRSSISEAFRMIFEGASGPESMVYIRRYNGRCQNWHTKLMKQIPVVIDSDPSDTYSEEEVVSYFEEQRLFLRKNYNPRVHGGIRVAVSFGNFYLLGFKLCAMKVKELRLILSKKPSGIKAQHARNTQAAANSRPDSRLSVRSEGHGNFGYRGHHNRNTPRGMGIRCDYPVFRNPSYSCRPFAPRNEVDFGNQSVSRYPSNSNNSQKFANRRSNPQDHPQSYAFIPSNGLDLNRLQNFLTSHNFVETEHRYEYRATVNMDVSCGIIVLNKNLKLTLFHLQDTKWFVLNVSRGRTDVDSQPTAIRIKIHSRPVITAAELAKREGCEDLLENAHLLLHRDENGEVDGIALDKYKGRINYMRYKDMTSYRFRGRRVDNQDDFLNRITFKLNYGKEYRVPKDGIFTQVTNQTELLLETELPDLEDKEECEEFMREIYAFSKDFTQRFVDQK